MDNWIIENIENIMLGVEIAGFILVGSLFVLYFAIARKVKKKRLLEQQQYESED